LGEGGEMTQALYAHMNNKTIKKKKENSVFEANKRRGPGTRETLKINK
jgi:hypothetical protein